MTPRARASGPRPAGDHPGPIGAVDLFCGAGGLTHGLAAAGVHVVVGVDLDGACKHPYEANNPGARFEPRDVSSLKPDEVNGWYGNYQMRLLAGCAPCQPFSSYAQRYETKGTERWGLLNHFARLVEGVRPDFVTMENVSTVTKHEVFHDFVSTLEKRGYHVWYDVVDCADYGLPQRRKRTVLLASLHGSIQLERPTGQASGTVRDAISNLPAISHGGCDDDDPLHTASRLSPLNLRRIKASLPGGSWRDWPQQLVAACHRRDTGLSYPGVYGRMTWDEPSPTLTTQFYGFGSGRFGHPEQDRALSLREGAILQGFPRSYSFIPHGAPVQIKLLGRLIGNAVPVDLGRAIGQSLLKHVGGLAPAATSRERRIRA